MSTSFISSPSSSRITRPVPPQRPGMTVLDRTAFDVKLTTLAGRIPASKTGTVKALKILKGQTLDLPRMVTVLPDPSEPKTGRLLLLNSPDKNDLPDGALQEMAEAAGVDEVELVHHEFTLDYAFWSSADLIEAILPEELKEGAPGSFTLTGHLAHMNLKDEYLPYKKVIGQIILDKNKGLRTVVNKLDNIDTEFRFFKMEVLAGDEDFMVNLSESGCKFTFDFSTVYWNSRLSTEHDRLIGQFQPGQLIADVFAGVGPFAVPAAKKRCFVLGNDLNPSSTSWMERNRSQNKVEKTLRVSTRDGREFIRTAAVEAYTRPFEELKPLPAKRVKTTAKPAAATATTSSSSSSTSPQPSVSTNATPRSTPPPTTPPTTTAPIQSPRFIDHFVMNLPGSALDEFVDAFRGSYTGLADLLLSDKDNNNNERVKVEDVPMPMVHVHCFSHYEGEEAERDVSERASKSLGFPISRAANTEGFALKEVRRVAPKKLMYCVSFRLPREVAFGPPTATKEAVGGN